MSKRMSVLELAVRLGLVSPEATAGHPEARTPEDLVRLGLVRPEDADKLRPAVSDDTLAQAGLDWLREMKGEPTQLGRYRILEELGRGGMGVVYRAEDTTLKRQVALKVMRPGFDEDEHKRFQREARAAAVLKHPGIVPVHDVGETEGRPYLVMDVLEGQSLAERIEKKSIPRRDAVECVRQAAEAIAHAHEHGVLHRDVKPCNILVTSEGRAVVMDFGLAKLAEFDHRKLTVSGMIFGTPAYMSPEQALGKWDQVNARSDVFSLGATLYEVLTGAPPFMAPAVPEVLQKVVHAEPVAPRALDRSIDRDLETICLKALEKAPARRYGTAREFAEDLGRWLAGEPIRARPPSYFSRLARKIRRRKGAVIAAAAILTGLSVSLAAWFWPGQVRVTSSPDGAAIYVDGEDTGQRTPATVTVWPGSRRITLRQDGFDEIHFEVKIGARQRVELARNLIPDHGTLTIESVPPGADLVVGDKPVGRTPYGPIRVAPREWNVSVRLDGWQPYEGTVRVEPGERKLEKIPLQPVPLWSLAIESRFATVGDDVDGDKIPDVFVVDPRSVRAVSGGRGRVLWKNDTASVAQVHARGFGDADGDGASDVLLISETFFACLSGRTGARLWIEPGRVPTSLRHRPSDLNGDGVADFLLAGQRIEIRSGRSGLPIGGFVWFNGAATPLTMAKAGDLDGDGAADALGWIGEWSTLVAISGKTGELLWQQFDVPTVDEILPAGDADGDGRTDVLSSPRADSTIRFFRCHSGADGTELWRRSLEGTARPPYSDVDGDGMPDILVGGGRWLTLVSGKTGRDLWTRSPGGEIGLARIVGDLNQDGAPDVAATSGENLTFLSGRDGKILAVHPIGRKVVSLLPASADLIVATEDGDVWRTEISGAVLWSARFPRASVVPLEILEVGEPVLLLWSPSGLNLLRLRPR